MPTYSPTTDLALVDRGFGGRCPRAICQVCGQPLARLSAREWVDRADDKAHHHPIWHAHVPISCPECHVLIDEHGMCPNPCCLLVQPADVSRRTMGEVRVGDYIGHVGNSWWLGRVWTIERGRTPDTLMLTLHDGTELITGPSAPVVIKTPIQS